MAKYVPFVGQFCSEQVMLSDIFRFAGPLRFASICALNKQIDGHTVARCRVESQSRRLSTRQFIPLLVPSDHGNGNLLSVFSVAITNVYIIILNVPNQTI